MDATVESDKVLHLKLQHYRCLLNLLKHRLDIFKAAAKYNDNIQKCLPEHDDSRVVSLNVASIQSNLSRLSSAYNGYRCIENAVEKNLTLEVRNELAKISSLNTVISEIHMDEAYLSNLKLQHIQVQGDYNLFIDSQKAINSSFEEDQETMKQISSNVSILGKVNTTRTIAAMLIAVFYKNHDEHVNIQKHRTGFIRDLTIEDFIHTWDVGFQ